MLVIAGATGHVGSVVANELIAKGQKVRVIVRTPQKGEAWAKKGAEVAVGVLDDRAFLAGALRGANGFFALLPPNFAVPDIYAAQREQADAIAGAVHASGVAHVVMLSSVGADLPTGNGPIRGLHYLENALRATGAQLTALRAGSFQENIANSLSAARNAGIYPNFMPSADAAMPMVAARDIGVLAAQLLLENRGKNEIVDLIGPAYSVRQLAEKLGAALGKPLRIVDVPQPGWVGAMVQAGLPQQVAEVMAEMYAGFQSGQIRPRGDRQVQGKTEIDEVIESLTK